MKCPLVTATALATAEAAAAPAVPVDTDADAAAFAEMVAVTLAAAAALAEAEAPEAVAAALAAQLCIGRTKSLQAFSRPSGLIRHLCQRIMPSGSSMYVGLPEMRTNALEQHLPTAHTETPD